MEQRIAEFVEILRHNGLPVAVSETVDAARALQELGVSEREVTRAALRATLCKRERDGAVFDRAFDFYFSRSAKMLAQLDQSLLARIEAEGLLGDDELKMIAWVLTHSGGQFDALTSAALQGDLGHLAKIFRNAALQVDYSNIQSRLQSGFYARRLLSAAGAETMRSQLGAISDELKARGVTAQGLEVTSKHLAEALRQVEAAARQEVERQIEARIQKGDGLAQKALYTLSPQEVSLAQAAVRTLAEQLKARLVRREKSRRRGQLNPRRTLRKNLSAGGVPMVPYFRRRRPQRPDVVVLCDVSDSVRTTSRLMLLFAWSLHAAFRSIRSFIFVSEIGEVSKYFADKSPDLALERALNSEVISLASNSNYGRALADFTRESLGAISRRTTVFIIGDGRSNHNPSELWALETIKRKAKRVVWVCPEPKANWGLGDSDMPLYAKAVNHVIVVQHLSDLRKIAAELLRAGR